MKKFLFFIFIIILLVPVFYFIKNNEEKNNFKEIVVESGDHSFSNGITVKEGEVLIIKPGARLKMGENSRIVIDGKIIAKGTEDKKIVFEAEKDYWRGVKINGLDEAPIADDFWVWLTKGDKKRNKEFFENLEKRNVFNYCVFKDVSTESREFAVGNKWKSTIEAYNTALIVSNSSFENILHIGGVLTQRSYVLIKNNDFKANEMHKNINCTDNSVVIVYDNEMIQDREKNQRCADGIWINDSTALVANNLVKGIGDDGIDTDNSKIIIMNNEVISVLDDGIDVDKKGKAFVVENKIQKIKENAILISEESSVALVQNIIEGSETGVAVRDGSKAVGSDLDIVKNKKGIKLFNSFPCVLSGEDFIKTKNEILKMADEEVELLRINNVFSANDLINVLEENYKQGGEYHYFVKDNFQKGVQEIFKIVGNLVLNKGTNLHRNNGFCFELENSFYLTSSKLKENDQDILAFDNYQLKMEDVIFDNQEKEQKARGLFSNNFSCDLVDELNVAPVMSNSKMILEKIKEM